MRFHKFLSVWHLTISHHSLEELCNKAQSNQYYQYICVVLMGPSQPQRCKQISRSNKMNADPISERIPVYLVLVFDLI